MSRVLIPYGRFSGRRQEAGDSQRRQDAAVESMLAAEEAFGPITLDTSYNLFDKGLSAFRGANWKRGDLGKFLDLVGAGVIKAGTVLAVERVSRFTRQAIRHGMDRLGELLDAGIVVRFSEPPLRITAGNIDSIEISVPLSVMMTLAHHESREKSRMIGSAWAEKKRLAAEENRPHGSVVPAWVVPTTRPHEKDPGRLVVTGYELHPERARVVQTMFRWATEDGLGARKIWLRLMGKGVNWKRGDPIKDSVPPMGKGEKWTLSYVKKILAGREAIGEYQPHFRSGEKPQKAGRAIPGFYPAVVDEATFLAAQASKKARSKKGGRPTGGHNGNANLFTHLVKDARDREPVHFKHRQSGGRFYRYLITADEGQAIPYESFERGVLHALAQLKAKDVDSRREADEATAEVTRLEGEYKKLTAALGELGRQLDELDPARWPARVVARLAELEDDVKAKELEVAQANLKLKASGKVAILEDLQSAAVLLDEVRGTDREAGVRKRIKDRLPTLVESIWVFVQPTPTRQGRYSGRYTHVKIHLRGGSVRYFVVPSGNIKELAVLDLSAIDFSAGNLPAETA